MAGARGSWAWNGIFVVAYVYCLFLVYAKLDTAICNPYRVINDASCTCRPVGGIVADSVTALEWDR